LATGPKVRFDLPGASDEVDCELAESLDLSCHFDGDGVLDARSGGKDGDIEKRNTVFVGLGLTCLEIENWFSRTSGGKLHRCGVNG
jgi:hypothetical protein